MGKAVFKLWAQHARMLSSGIKRENCQTFEKWLKLSLR